MVYFRVLMMAGLLSIGSAASGISHNPQVRGNSLAFSNVLGDRSVSALRLRGGSDVKEAATGILFPKELVSGSNTLTFLGAGERKKAIFGPLAVNVYAIGLYVDSELAKTAGPGADAAETLITGAFPKALRLVMARAVSADKIGDALADQIEPRIKGTDAPLEEFKGFFKAMASLEAGQEILFAIDGAEMLVTAPGGTRAFESRALCDALLHVYLGEEPVSPTAKAAMVHGFVALTAPA
uniref:Chalcone isomerase domain-containing protein n=1 Tax=Cryptomonas curvata TaxID=233186 RepID=A0A7S0M1E9_9CRYP|mmetsp:Transcript_1666/g.3480  ORF Transcript_1666/g.3480 Transcript_1666/m.3480 type:complete len:239 (+) Transcript_1666:80-796(+)